MVLLSEILFDLDQELKIQLLVLEFEASFDSGGLSETVFLRPNRLSAHL